MGMPLYQLHETQRVLLAPMVRMADLFFTLLSNPLSPLSYTPLSRPASAGYGLFKRIAKEYTKPDWDIHTVHTEGVDVTVQEQMMMQKPFCRLISFNRFSDDARSSKRMNHQPIVLLVAPLSGHHATLLRETVRELLKDHQVYITDWIDARMIPLWMGPFHLSDYVEYIQEFIRFIGPEKTNIISVCQPTVPVLGALSLMATAGESLPRKVIMMGGPIDPRKSPTTVNNLATTRALSWFEDNVIYRVPLCYPGIGRPVYPGFLQHAGFIAMNQERHMQSHYDYFLNLTRGNSDDAAAHCRFYNEYNAVLDIPAEYYLDTIKTVFQDFALPKGMWEVNGKLVRPQDISKTSLLTIEGKYDDISGSGQTRAAHNLCTKIHDKNRAHLDVEAGHFGIFSGSRWREDVYPVVRNFISQRS